jgi:hypothetical protein
MEKERDKQLVPIEEDSEKGHIERDHDERESSSSEEDLMEAPRQTRVVVHKRRGGVKQ